MKNTVTLADIDKAEQRLLALQTVFKAELQDVESRRRTSADFLRPGQLKDTLRQVDDGAAPNEGMDRRLWEVLNTPEMQRFHFHTPGLAALRRLRERLIAEQQAATAPKPPPPPVLAYRYTGEPWKVKVAGGRHNTGDVVQLTAEVAARYAAVLEPVSPGVAVGAKV